MNPDFLFALFVFCQDYHSGQGSRLYRILSRLSSGRYRISLNDAAYHEIRQGDGMNWYWAGEYYKELVEKYGRIAA